MEEARKLEGKIPLVKRDAKIVLKFIFGE